jgi:nitrile hydratase beta subunit
MNYFSNADLGGRNEQRAITPEPEDEVFHQTWEPRVLGIVLAMNAVGLWNIDMNRSSRETLPNYLQLSYYEIWLAALEKNLRISGALDEDAPPPPHVLHASEVAATLARGSPCSREATRAARFEVGQAVRTRADRPNHHTRLPAYARDKAGIIERVHGMHVFADSNAQGLGEAPQWLYTVTFEGIELWGSEAQRAVVSIDAWEPYLLAA